MDDMQIDVNGVTQLLHNLDLQAQQNSNKIFAMELAPCIMLLYQAWLDQEIVSLDWKKAFVTIGEIVHYQKITIQYLLMCHMQTLELIKYYCLHAHFD